MSGRYSEIRKAIIDKNVDIPPYTKIGIDREADIARGFYVSEGRSNCCSEECKIKLIFCNKRQF